VPWYVRCRCSGAMKVVGATATPQPRAHEQRVSEIRPAARRRDPDPPLLAAHAQLTSRMQRVQRAVDMHAPDDMAFARLLSDALRVRNALYLLCRHQRITRSHAIDVVRRCTRRGYDWLQLVLERAEDALEARSQTQEESACWPSALFEYSDLHVGTFITPLMSEAADACERDVRFEAPVCERYFLLFRLESAIFALHAGLRRAIGTRRKGPLDGPTQ
jgi:hypothetical protein